MQIILYLIRGQREHGCPLMLSCITYDINWNWQQTSFIFYNDINFFHCTKGVYLNSNYKSSTSIRRGGFIKVIAMLMEIENIYS